MKLQLSDEWSEFLRVLISRRVKFVLVGGHAVAAWAEPRMTEDLDIFVETSPDNARRLRRALVDFGFGSVAPPAEAFLDEKKIWMLGRKPNRIDILTGIDGVTFAEVWAGRVRLDFSGGELFLIGRDELLANKRASGRPKDLADAAALETFAPAPKVQHSERRGTAKTTPKKTPNKAVPKKRGRSSK